MSAAAATRTTAKDPMLILRLLVGLVFGAAVTLSLFWVMQYLIATADRSLDDAKRGALVDFVRVKKNEVIERKQIKPKKPPPPETPPPSSLPAL